MTTYYVSPNGSDSNNGLGPDASDATNKPWLTPSKAMSTGSPVVPGDIVYFSPGDHRVSTIFGCIAGLSSVGSPTQFIGDPTNAQGFKDGSGVRLAPAISRITTRTAAEGDGPIATNATNLITQDGTLCHGLQWKKLWLECKVANNVVAIAWNGATDWLFEDCVGVGARLVNWNTTTPTAGRNLTIRRCFTLTSVGVIGYNSVTAATNDADLNVVIEDSLVFGGIFNTAVQAWGTAGNAAGGLTLRGTTVVTSTTHFMSTEASKFSTVVPITATGNLFILPNTAGFNAGTAGQIVDGGYNRFVGGAYSHTNVTPAATSKFGVEMNLVLPHLVKWGLEMPRADFLGWTDAAHANQKFSASGIVTADFFGRTIRPWGAGASIGCMQAVDVAQDTGSAITGGGANSLKLTGAGEISLRIPVDATGFTVSVRTKSTSYGGTNWPQLIVVANPSIGVAADTTVTATSATEATITTATITPTAKGVMEVRLVSRSTSVSSTTHFDLLTST